MQQIDRSKANPFNYKLFFTIMLFSLAPSLYSTIRIHFLGYLPNDYGVNIASQLSWVSIIYEIFSEALLLPLYFFIGNAITRTTDLSNKFYSGIAVTALVFLSLSIILIIWVRPLLKLMAQKEVILELTVNYIRLESASIVLYSIVRFMQIVIIILNNKKSLLFMLASQVLLSFVSDLFMVSPFKYSLSLGVNGIAYGNLITNSILILIGYTSLKREIGPLGSMKGLSFKWMRSWWSIGKLSGIESLIRNLVYIVIILRMVNMIEHQGTYWVANSFIWNWLLLPVLALGELIKRETSISISAVNTRLKTYLVATAIIILIIAGTSVFWPGFIKTILNAYDYEAVLELVALLSGFYIVFAVNNIIDSIFYGLGRTDLMLYQSLAVNGIYYTGVFIAFKVGLFVPSVHSIAIVFGIGIILDSLITFFLFYKYSKRAGFSVPHV